MQFVKNVLFIGRRLIFFVPREAIEGLSTTIMRRTDQHITEDIGSENEVDRH